MEYLAVAAFGILGVFVLAGIYRRDRAKLRALRGAVFAPAYPLFESYRVTQDSVDFPELRGRYRGHDFHVDALVDMVTFRKLPSLWLRVSLLAPVPYRGTLDIMVRSQNVEFYSPANELDHAIQPPAGWPAGTIVKTDNPDAMPPAALVDPHMSFFAAPKAKEILITPKGVRLVYQTDQGTRAEYLVLRSANFAAPQVTAEVMADLLDRAIALYQDLAGRSAS
ncbi:hypothetical protein [Dongia sedimenti]|uniref:Uncharacterized protein n=1 Tax=Dongia sedimenti TaxID=3064282 RepID=A0ABU0YNT5_9PROT|nr:hypothetical protein [Rhodospirillaceae bacterium R-7]